MRKTLILCALLPSLLSVFSLQAQNYTIVNIRELPELPWWSRYYMSEDEFLYAENNRIYTLTNGGFELFKEFPSDSMIMDLFKDSQGRLWVESDGIYMLEGENIMRHYELPNDEPHDAWRDYDFLGELNGKIYTTFSLVKGNGDERLYELHELKDDGTVLREQIPSPARDIVGTANGPLFILGEDGVYVKNGAQWESDFIFSEEWAHDIAVDSKGDLYVVMQYGYYHRKATTGEYTYENLSRPLEELLIDKEDRLIFNAYEWIIVTDGDVKFEIDGSKGLQGISVLDIAFDSQGKVVALTRNFLDNQQMEYHLQTIIFNSNEDNLWQGIVFHDLNADGVQNEGEPGIANHFVMLTPGNAFSITNTDGKFFFLPIAGENTITWQPKGFWQESTSPTSFTFNYPSEIPNLSIGLQWASVHDVAASLTGSATRPGFDTYYWINIRNEGSVEELPEVNFIYPEDFTLLESSIEPTSENSGQLTWNLAALPSLKNRSIQLKFNIPASTPLNTNLFSLLEITGVTGETDLGDNVDSLHQVITGSFDPNDKLVTEGILAERYVEIGSNLTYTIRFQNTGTDTAFVVSVRDTLDVNLDIPSLEILDASHDMTYFLNERVLNFTFNNIELPDSTRDEPNSHGYIKYRIKNKEGIADGTDVKNSAAIYFDFNAPVITNVTSNRYVTSLPNSGPTGVEEAVLSDLLYPNPTRGVITIGQAYTGDFQRATLFTSTGAILETHGLHGNTIYLKETTPGLYFIRLEGKSKSVVAKVMIGARH